MSEATPVPEDFHTITPHLVVRDAAQAVAFYEQALGAEELYRNLGPDGRSIVHSELLLGDSRFFVNEEFAEHSQHSPLHYTPAPRSRCTSTSQTSTCCSLAPSTPARRS